MSEIILAIAYMDGYNRFRREKYLLFYNDEVNLTSSESYWKEYKFKKLTSYWSELLLHNITTKNVNKNFERSVSMAATMYAKVIQSG